MSFNTAVQALDPVYCPEMLVFHGCFEVWKQKEVGGSYTQAVDCLRDRWHSWFDQVIGDDEGGEGRSIVVVQPPVVCDVWPEALNPVFQSFRLLDKIWS